MLALGREELEVMRAFCETDSEQNDLTNWLSPTPLVR
jgi:hypothetical protein